MRLESWHIFILTKAKGSSCVVSSMINECWDLGLTTVAAKGKAPQSEDVTCSKRGSLNYIS